MLGSLRMDKSMVQALTDLLQKYRVIFKRDRAGIDNERLVGKYVEEIVDVNYAYYASKRGAHIQKPKIKAIPYQEDSNFNGSYKLFDNTILYAMGSSQEKPFTMNFRRRYDKDSDIYILAFLTVLMGVICHEFLHYTQSAEFGQEKIWDKKFTPADYAQALNRMFFHYVYGHRKTELAAYALSDAIVLAVFTDPKIYVTEDRFSMNESLVLKNIFRQGITKFEYNSPMELQAKLDETYNNLIGDIVELTDVQKLELRKQYIVPRSPKQFERYEREVYAYYSKIFRRYIRDFEPMNRVFGPITASMLPKYGYR